MSSFKSLILQVLEYDLKPECLVILAEEEMVFIDLGFLICLFTHSLFTLHFIIHSASNVSLFQLQKVGLSSSLPICTQSTPAPSPASQRSAHSTLTCSPVLRLTPLALPQDPTSSPPRCIQPCVCLPFSVFLQLTFPQRPWPVDGGEANPPAAVPPSLILTGSSHKFSMLSHIE